MKRAKRNLDPLITPLASKEAKGRLFDIFSVALVMVGVAFWLVPIQELTIHAEGFVQAGTVVTLLVYIFMATQLTTVGVAFYAYNLSNRRTTEEADEIESAIDRLEGLLVEHKMTRLTTTPTVGLDMKQLRENISSHKLSRLHVLSLVESVLLIVLYGWIVNEYRSNIYLQDWIRTNIGWASLLLSELAFYIAVGLVFGVLISQLGLLRPLRRRRSELLRSEIE